MSELKTTTSNSWSGTQAAALAVFSLLLGISGGWLIGRSFAAQVPARVGMAPTSAPSGVSGQMAAANFNPVLAASSTAELKQSADAQAAPLLEQLKADPKRGVAGAGGQPVVRRKAISGRYRLL